MENEQTFVRGRTIAWAVAVNLGVFVFATTFPLFKSFHHHWIFPGLALVFAFEWGLTGGLFFRERQPSFFDLKTARAAALFLMAFLVLMGVIRHQTVLACFGLCSLKLSMACMLAALVFGAESRREEIFFWTPLRSEMAGLGCLLWAVYLGLAGAGTPLWILDLVFIFTGLVFCLKWKKTSFLGAALGLFLSIGVRHLPYEALIILLNLAWISFLLVWAGPRWDTNRNRRESGS